MATVVAEFSMSLDGFIADPLDEVGPLFDWYGNGDVAVPTAVPERWTFHTSEASARHLREVMVPVLLGKGIRFFDNLTGAPVALDGPTVIEGTGVTHLYYQVGSRG